MNLFSSTLTHLLSHLDHSTTLIVNGRAVLSNEPRGYKLLFQNKHYRCLSDVTNAEGRRQDTRTILDLHLHSKKKNLNMQVSRIGLIALSTGTSGGLL